MSVSPLSRHASLGTVVSTLSPGTITVTADLTGFQAGQVQLTAKLIKLVDGLAAPEA